MKLKKHLNIVWLAINKPHLMEPAISVNRAVINGEATADAVIRYDSGESKRLRYKLTVSPAEESLFIAENSYE
jgi:hypothetical protein